MSLKRMLALSWLYLAVLVLGAWVMSSWSLAWGVLAGGIISIASFLVMYRDVASLFDSIAPGGQAAESLRKKKKGLVLKFWLRLFLIGLILLMLIKYGGINVFGLILGLSTVVVTITFSAFGVVWRYYFSRR